jgi:hypothetical protein
VEKISMTERLMFIAAVRCMATAFKETVGDHPIAPQLSAGVIKTWMVFGVLFNKAVDSYHEPLRVISNGTAPRPNFWVAPEKAIDPVSEDNKVEIVDGHYHEFMDRVNCLNMLFDSLVVSHTVTELLRDDVNRVAEELAELYQASAMLHTDRP